jgi:hypothetical protein
VTDGIDVAVEVYSPRELLAVDAWVHGLTDLQQYIDIPASYSLNLQARLDSSIPPPDRPDSWSIAEMLMQTREGVLAEITRDVERSIRVHRPLKVEYRHPGTPLLTSVELDDVRPAPGVGPQRIGRYSCPGFSGYSPAGVFGTILNRALKKARKRQTLGVSAAARALVVYLMGTRIAEDLVHPDHLKAAESALRGVDPRTYALDAIAFVVRAHPQGLASILTVADDTTFTVAQVQAMFGRSR